MCVCRRSALPCGRCGISYDRRQLPAIWRLEARRHCTPETAGVSAFTKTVHSHDTRHTTHHTAPARTAPDWAVVCARAVCAGYHTRHHKTFRFVIIVCLFLGCVVWCTWPLWTWSGVQLSLHLALRHSDATTAAIDALFHAVSDLAFLGTGLQTGAKHLDLSFAPRHGRVQNTCKNNY